MIEMPYVNDDEPMGDNYEYGYFPDSIENGQMVMNEGAVDGYA
ncbi:MAG: hypothetical protein WC365_01325 [Candidatus Babeliales bacterium]|jgi:hypothetical protein